MGSGPNLSENWLEKVAALHDLGGLKPMLCEGGEHGSFSCPWLMGPCHSGEASMRSWRCSCYAQVQDHVHWKARFCHLLSTFLWSSLIRAQKSLTGSNLLQAGGPTRNRQDRLPACPATWHLASTPSQPLPTCTGWGWVLLLPREGPTVAPQEQQLMGRPLELAPTQAHP